MLAECPLYLPNAQYYSCGKAAESHGFGFRRLDDLKPLIVRYTSEVRTSSGMYLLATCGLFAFSMARYFLYNYSLWHEADYSC